eukprot:TRINITY_DN71659_c0_g1_i1.p1 TRINITY_DN71659_c0_g1~~TRINITY_DN71659_c0_g1_i1.p1  ORF type:complete len:993 (+),score=89.16 TRINITY_DN71659_c0_g1_i1:86-2980(+)
MLPTTTKKEIIIIPDRSPSEEGSEYLSFYTESENSSLSSNRHVPAPEYFAPLYSVSKLSLESSKLKYPNLLKMLNKFGEYPDKYRSLVWRYLLSLPLNKLAYENLLKLGIHPAFEGLRKRYPIESQRLFCRTQRLLSALAYWNPLLAEVEYLPGLVYPFAKVLEHDDLVLFETVVSLIMHWFQNCFSAFPQPPVHLLQMVEDCINKEDPELGRHMRTAGFHPVQYAWPLLRTMFSEVLPKPQWVMVIDHLFTFSQQPQLVFAVVAAYLIQLKNSFLTIKDSAHLAACVRTMSPVDIKRLLKKAKELLPYMTGDKCPEPYTHNIPISKPNQASYPIMGGYPKYVVELGSQIRRQILEREQDILKQKQLVHGLQKKNKDLLEQEVKLRKQQEGALRAEKERIAQKTAETEVEILQRKSMANKEKAKRLSYVRELESRLANSLQTEDQLRKLQEENLAAAYNQRTALRKQELAEQQELEELKGLEYKATEKISELVRLRQTEAQNRTGAAREELYETEAEMRQKQAEEKWRAEDQMTMMKRQEWIREKELELERKRIEQMQEIQARQDEVMRKERELEIAKMEHEREMRRLAEEGMYGRSMHMEGSRTEEEVRASPGGMKSTFDARLPSQPSQESQPGQMQSVHESDQQQYSIQEEQKQPEPSPDSAESHATEKKPISSGARDTVKMSIHEREPATKYKESPQATNAYSEPFTFKNTAAGLTDVAHQDATRKVRASDTLFTRPYIQRAAPSAEYPTEQPIDTLHAKTRSSPELEGSAVGNDLLERHNRVKQQIEELERKFGMSEYERGAQGESSGTSSIYSSSQGRSPSAGQSPEGKYEVSSGTSISGTSFVQLETIETSKEELSPSQVDDNQSYITRIYKQLLMYSALHSTWYNYCAFLSTVFPFPSFGFFATGIRVGTIVCSGPASAFLLFLASIMTPTIMRVAANPHRRERLSPNSAEPVIAFN